MTQVQMAINTSASSPKVSDFHLSRYELARAAEAAEYAKATKITTRSPTRGSSSILGHCIHCGEVATLELVFHYRQHGNGHDPFEWSVFEKYCNQCAESRLAEVATYSAKGGNVNDGR
jgi:hypothetical protein